MRIFLTGITGNLGSEVYQSLIRGGHDIIAIIRARDEDETRSRLGMLLDDISEKTKFILYDLENPSNVKFPSADYLIHCAGTVHFRDAGVRNSRMTAVALDIATRFDIPILHVSTAFLDKPNGSGFRNEYEKDKARAEEIVTQSSVPWAIIRPSILTGNSKTGKMLQFSGYYLVIQAFLKAIEQAGGRSIEFPMLRGTTNIIPVNWVAGAIVALCEKRKTGVFYATNPSPPDSQELISESLDILGMSDRVHFQDISFEEYSNSRLSELDERLFNFLKHFQSYWTGRQVFPISPELTIPSEPLGHNYIEKILRYTVGRRWR